MKLLIANRGEIAVRIIRTCRDIGVKTVVGYCESERDASYVTLADEAYSLGANAKAFTDIEAFLRIAKRAEATAIHPGYGFLSESPEFAQAVQNAGITWIGPSPQVLLALGDKAKAREAAAKVNVKAVPGIDSAKIRQTDVQKFVQKHGYPIVIKKVDGGGGRGINVIYDEQQFANYFQLHGETLDGLIVEKFLESARHIETQCVRDASGNFAVISTRDCSLQRRNQKLIEEAPAFAIPPEIAQQLTQNSRKLFETVDFQGAGTCEFLYQKELYFLEVNPRLQVEHTVSEEVTGIDLVRLQLDIAHGAELPKIPPVSGHSIELRITSENPQANMMPTLGRINTVTWPLGLGVRIDTAIREGDIVNAEFDSMLAKIIISGANRAEAISRAQRALQEFKIDGISTPAALYAQILAQPQYLAGEISTRWLETSFLPQWLEHCGVEQQDRNTAGTNADAEKMAATENYTFTIEIDGKRGTLSVPKDLIATSRRHTLTPQPLRRSKRIIHEESQQASGGIVNSPIQALVLKVCAVKDTQVKEGDLLVVLESMKMESYVYAPCSGKITEIAVADGDNVVPGALIARIEETK